MTCFSTSRHFARTPAEVFAAVRDPERLARWWGPDGFTNRFERFEFQPGGCWYFTMIGPDGTAYPNQAEFTRIEPECCVVIRHTCAPHFTLTLTFEPEAGGTRLHWAQAFDDPAVAEALRAIVVPANEQNLDRLAGVRGLTPA